MVRAPRETPFGHCLGARPRGLRDQSERRCPWRRIRTDRRGDLVVHSRSRFRQADRLLRSDHVYRVIPSSIFIRDWRDDCAALREASLRGTASGNFDDQRSDCGLRRQDGGWPSSPGVVGNRVVLGFKLSQWTYSRRRGIRDCCRSLYQQDLARGSRVRAVDSNFMDLSRRLVASRAWRALAD